MVMTNEVAAKDSIHPFLHTVGAMVGGAMQEEVGKEAQVSAARDV
jgi:hypothetical protein